MGFVFSAAIQSFSEFYYPTEEVCFLSVDVQSGKIYLCAGDVYCGWILHLVVEV